jgi:hypothetical protein
MTRPPPVLRAVARWLVPARLLVDLAWRPLWPGGPGGSQVVGGALAVAVVLLAATQLRATSPRERATLGAVALALGVGALRAGSPEAAVVNGLHLAAPFAVWLVCRAAAEPELEATWRRAAWAPLGLSAAVTWLGAAPPVVSDGWPRFVGAWGNVHGAAVVAAVAAASAAGAALRGRRLEDVALALAAGVALAATVVRGPVVFAAGAVALGAGWSRRARAAGAAAAGAAVLAALLARGPELWALATLSTPDGGWGALGSHRVRIWTDATTTFLAGPWSDVVLGRGLGGQWGLHRHLDPHGDWLSLWFQLGLLGPVGWLAAGVGAARAAGAGPARGLVLAVMVLGLVGNDVLYRPSLLWWVAGAAGLAAGRRALAQPLWIAESATASQ